MVAALSDTSRTKTTCLFAAAHNHHRRAVVHLVGTSGPVAIRMLRAMKIPFAIVSMIASLFPTKLQETMSQSDPQDSMFEDDRQRLCNQPANARTQFGGVNCHVRGWPSIGGIVVGSFTAAELDWLGLSRSDVSLRYPDAESEDKICVKMLRLGARWWKSESFHKRTTEQLYAAWPRPKNFPPEIHVGWPSTGGIWVLKVPNNKFGPGDFAKVIMAFTMDERCAMLEQVGATFYEKVEDCPDIAETLEDGMANGKWWEERMDEDEEDDEYWQPRA